MALLTSVARRPQVSNRRWNRPWIRVQTQFNDLANPGEFRLQKTSSAGPHMAVDALDVRVRRVLIRRVLRAHHRMARLPAKGHRVHVLHALVAGVNEDD